MLQEEIKKFLKNKDEIKKIKYVKTKKNNIFGRENERAFEGQVHYHSAKPSSRIVLSQQKPKPTDEHKSGSKNVIPNSNIKTGSPFALVGSHAHCTVHTQLSLKPQF